MSLSKNIKLFVTLLCDESNGIRGVFSTEKY